MDRKRGYRDIERCNDNPHAHAGSKRGCEGVIVNGGWTDGAVNWKQMAKSQMGPAADCLVTGKDRPYADIHPRRTLWRFRPIADLRCLSQQFPEADIH